MLIPFGRWVEQIELKTEIDDIEAVADHEERFGTLTITVRKKETEKHGN